MVRVENNLNKNGLPHVCTALFWVFGGGLETFKRILCSGGNSLPSLVWIPVLLLVQDFLSRR